MFLFVCSMLIPMTMIIIGFIMWKKPPKKINNMHGYRTKRSMVNSKTWEFANSYVGKLRFYIGLIIFFLTLILDIMLYKKYITNIDRTILICVIIQMILMIIPTIITEKKLSKIFTEDGKYIK